MLLVIILINKFEFNRLMLKEEGTHSRELHEIKGRQMLAFCLLPMGNNFVNTFTLSYIYFYYVYVVGLDSFLTSIGIFIATIISAFGSIIFGVLSDNRPVGHHGKRKPFILFGLPIFIVTCILFWTPPFLCKTTGSMNWITAIYLWILGGLYAVGININWAAYNAMIPEQIETQQNRIQVAQIQGLLNLIAASTGVAVPIMMQSTIANPKETLWIYPSGHFLVGATLVIAVIICIIAVACSLITYLSVDESFLDKAVKKKSIFTMFKDMQYPLRHKNSRNYLGLTFTTNMGGQIFLTMPIPYLTYVLLAQGYIFTIYMLIVMIINFVSVFLWAIIIKKKGTLKSNDMAFIVIIFFLLALLIIFFNMPGAVKITLSLILIGIVCFGCVAFYLTPIPIIGAIVDEAPGKFPQKEFKKETLCGLYTGMSSVFSNIGTAMGTLFLGIYFSGGQETNVLLLTLVYPLCAIVYAIGWICNKRLSIKSQEGTILH